MLYLDYVLAGLQIRVVRMLAIGLPAALIAIAILIGLWRDGRAEDEELAGARPRETLLKRLAPLLVLVLAPALAGSFIARGSGATFTASTTSKENVLSAAKHWK